MKRGYFSLGLAAVIFAPAGPAQASLLAFAVALDGAQEVNAGGTPNQGDLDGFGIATLIVDDQTNALTWSIVANNIALPLVGAHIHQAPAGVNGPVVIDFSAQFSGTTTDPDVANMLANPSGFYVNLHNADFPGGAIRGQIGAPVLVTPNPVPAPPAMALLATAVGGLVVRRLRTRLR